jgi:hypothetical protein
MKYFIDDMRRNDCVQAMFFSGIFILSTTTMLWWAISPSNSFALMNANLAKEKTMKAKKVEAMQNDQNLPWSVDQVIESAVDGGECETTLGLVHVSNFAVGKEIEKLRKLGYKVKSTRNVGETDWGVIEISWCE